MAQTYSRLCEKSNQKKRINITKKANRAKPIISRHNNHITLVLVYISETTEVPAQQHHITITQHTTKHDTPQLIESDTEVIEEYTTKFRRGSKEDETAAVKTKKTIIRKKKPKNEEDNVVVIEEELEDIKPKIPSIPKKQFMPIEEVTTTIDVEEIIPTRIEEAEEVEQKEIKALPAQEKVKPTEIEEVKEQITVTEDTTKLGKPKKTTKKKIIKRHGKEQKVTEVVTVEEEEKAPETTVTEGPVEEIVEETIKSLPGIEMVVPTEVEEVKEQVTVTEEVSQEGKPKKVTKKKVIRRKGKQQQVTEFVTIEEQGKAPVTSVTETPLEEIIDEIVVSLPVLEDIKPTEVEEMQRHIIVTEDVIKKSKEKEIIESADKEQQVTEIVSIEQKENLPITISGGPIGEILEVLSKIEYIKPIECVHEEITVVEEITKEGKPKKIIKKRITIREGKEQRVIEETTVEEHGKSPVTTIIEGPVEEVLQEFLKSIPTSDYVGKSNEVEEIREQVTVTEGTKEDKPIKTTKKRIIKRQGKKQQITELVTVEERGKTPISILTEGPMEELIEEIIKPLPAPEQIKPSEVEKVCEQITMTEEVTKEGKPKKIVKKKIIKRKGREQQVSEVVTIEERDKPPVTIITDGPIEEIVEETIKALPMKSGEVEEIREQVTVTQEITKEDKPRKTTKKKIIKLKGKEQQVTEVITVEEQGKEPVTTVTEGPVEKVIEEMIKSLPISERMKPTEIEEVHEQVTVAEEIKEGKPKKKITKKKQIRQKGREQHVSETITVEEEGKLPVITITEGPTEEIIEETLKVLSAPEYAKPDELEEIRKQVTITQEMTEEGKSKQITKQKAIKRKGKKQQVTEIVLVEEEGKSPVTIITEGPIEEIVKETVRALPTVERVDPIKVEEVVEEVTVTEIVTEEGKPEIVKRKIPKKVSKKVSIPKEEKEEIPEVPEISLRKLKKPVKLERLKVTKVEATKLEVQKIPMDKPQFAQIKLRKTRTMKRPVEKKEKIPRVLLRSRIIPIKWPPAIKYLKIEEFEPNEVQNGILSRNVEEAAILSKSKKKKVKRLEKEIAKLEKLDQEFEELKKELPLEKLVEPLIEKPEKKVKKKKPVEKLKGEKPQLMKISIKEQKPIKPKFEEPVTPLFAQIKLKKAPVKPKKKEDKDEIKFPKVLLRSRITEHEWPPSIKYCIITELEPNYVQNGELSRTMEEALKLKKMKHKKVKFPEKEITELEKVDQEFEKLKKIPLEKGEEIAPYERKPKSKESEEEKPKKLKIGKGKPRSAEEEEPEIIKLKKIPEKVPSVPEKLAPIAKKKDEVDKPEKEKEEKEYPKLKPFEPYEIETTEIELEELEELEYPKKPEKVPKKMLTKKPKKEHKTPVQETEAVPIVPGVPKPREPQEEEEIKRRIPESEASKEKPEKIKLKPWKKPEEEKEQEKKPEYYLKFVPKDDDIVETVEIVTTVNMEETPEKKQRKIKKKKTTTKRGDEKPKVIEEITIEEEGVEPMVTVEEIVEDKLEAVSIELKPVPIEEIKEEIVTSEIMSEDGAKKTVRKKRVTKKREGKEQITEEVIVEEEGKKPLTATTELHEDTTREIHEKPKHKRPTKPKADEKVTEGKPISYLLQLYHHHSLQLYYIYTPVFTYRA